jgi:hypothetical protein
MSDISVQETTKNYLELIEKILQHFAGGIFKDEVKIAKSQFFDNAGILDEKAHNYELRMNQFFDWYFFTRELAGYGQTPLDSYHMARELRFSSQEIALIDKLKAHRHSLFEFNKIKGGDVHLQDLLKGDRLIVKQSPWIYGFDSDEIFEARLLPAEDTWIFTKGFCFHPAEAKKFILSEIKRHKKDADLNPEDMMLRLVRMRYKFERYRHVKVDLIYSNDSKVGF